MADTPVDANTDDLDAFNDLFHGNSEVPSEDEAVEEVDLADDSGATETETEETDDTEEATADDESDESEEEAESEEEPEEDILKPKKRTSAQERIKELTAEKYAERRLREELERRLAALEEVQKKEEIEAPVKEANAPDPDALDANGELKYPLGEFDPKYIADLTRFTLEKETAAIRQKMAEEDAQKKQEAEDAALATDWEAKLAKSEEGLEDLRPTIASLENEFGNLEPEFGTYLAKTIMSLDHGPEVLYYLANNIDEARRIVASGPMNATLALGKIEARIESALKPKATKPVPTKAPEPPITTRGNSGRISVAPDTDDLDKFESLFYKK